MGKFKSTSPCCNAPMRKHYDEHGLDTFWCMKCGKFVPWLKIVLTDGIEEKSIEESIRDANLKSERNENKNTV